jgi:arsenate reductase
VLARASLIRSERHSRSIVYRAELSALRDVASFLLTDCCGGYPEICASSIDVPTPKETAMSDRATPSHGSQGPRVTIYHNPQCGTSRNTLGLIRNAGIEPTIILYLKTPPTRAALKDLIARMGSSTRDLIRQKGTPYHDLGLDDQSLSDDKLLDAMMAHPILINRPIVVSEKGVLLCRPSERVLELLPPQRGAFRKEDGEPVVDCAGRPVAST